MTVDHALIIDSSKTHQAITEKLLTNVGISFDCASSEMEVWKVIKEREAAYDMILVSRAALSKELDLFVSRLRALRNYSSVPVVLMINDKREDEDIAGLYEIGFTQIFSRKELYSLQEYIEQTQGRNTFTRDNDNKVIIIEDDIALQITIQAILEEKHCECFCFASAEEALEHVSSIQPTMITCDFFLDGRMTGLDFILRVKKSGHPWCNVPILAMTGMDDPTRKSELVRSGANDYLAKPVDSLELSVRAENLIRYKHLLDTVEKQRKDMQYLAMHDQLTGLYNRHFIAEEVHLRISEAQRHKLDYSMIVLDIDHFKQINDNHGHDKGDDVLIEVGNFLKNLVRGEDIVARLGGEEFVVLLNRCDLNNAVHKAEDLRQRFEMLNPAGIHLTASFGVAQLSQSFNTFDKLFKAADIAVYLAKSNGRNRVESVNCEYVSELKNSAHTS